jgi:glycosyltransferase involved in cell wall biosynthesis
MTFFTLPQGVRPPSDAPFRRAVLASLRRADRILVPSESTAAAMRRLVPGLVPDRIKKIPLGVDDDFTLDVQGRAPKMRRLLRLPERYILFVGTLEPRKNLLRLVTAYTRLVADGGCPDHLVLAGRKGWNVEPLLAQVSHPALRQRVHILGYVSGEDLPALYAGANLFVFPSIEEGFGLPPIEAMACGTPTVASSVSAMAEVLQGAAELVDPKDTDAIAAGLRKVLTDGQTRRRLREAGLRLAAQYRWDKVARKTLGVYEDVAATAPREMTDNFI